jgi:multimeric flavodoxin WrbA
MQVLGIYGSPRAGGNSDLLLDEALRGAAEAGAEISRVVARDLAIGGCRECGGCDETGVCVQADAMTQVYPLLISAPAIIIATPVFFYAMPAQLKALIDRAQARWSQRALVKPKHLWKAHEAGTGYLIAVGATKGKDLFAGLELTARYFFDALDKNYEGGLCFRQVEGQGDIRHHPQAFEQAHDLGRVAAGGVDKPPDEIG